MKRFHLSVCAALAICLTVLSCDVASAQSPKPRSMKPKINEHHDLVFAEPGGVKLLVDVDVPAASEKPPLVMYIHGGGWQGGDRKHARLRWLLVRGYAVARVEYRMSHEAIFPAQIHDCKGVLRWLRAREEEFGYDAERVVVAGSSAGGHLAALMGTSGDVEELEGNVGGNLDQSSRVQGVVDYYGPTDFLLRAKNQPAKTDDPKGSVYKLLGGSVSEKQSLATLASPATHVTKDDPPLLMFHGEDDRVVYLSQSQRLGSAYEKIGLHAQLQVIPKAGHGWKPPSDGEYELVLEFLAKHLRRGE